MVRTVKDCENFVLHALHLINDPRVIDQRAAWYAMYMEKELNLEGLRKKAPLIARAISLREQREE